MEITVMRNTKEKRGNGGFSLVELIIVIAIMAVLVGILAPQYLSYMHKAKVAADWANLKNYFTEIQADYISTGEWNPEVPLLDYNDASTYEQREVHFLSGQTIKLKEGYYAVTKQEDGYGYQICYECNEYLAGNWEKHRESCELVLK